MDTPEESVVEKNGVEKSVVSSGREVSDVINRTPGRNIILLSDGTGNSAGKLNKTNVWRLYQALAASPSMDGIVCRHPVRHG